MKGLNQRWNWSFKAKFKKHLQKKKKKKQLQWGVFLSLRQEAGERYSYPSEPATYCSTTVAQYGCYVARKIRYEAW